MPLWKSTRSPPRLLRKHEELVARRLSSQLSTRPSMATFRKACIMNRSLRPSAPTLLKVAGLVLLGIASSVFARDRDGRLNARLRSVQEVPAITSPATGRFSGVFDEQAGSISYELSYSGLEGDVRQGHIHIGQRGVNGGIMVWLCQTSFYVDPSGLAPTVSAIGYGQRRDTGRQRGRSLPARASTLMEFADFVAAIRAGVAYVNVHSSKFPDGRDTRAVGRRRRLSRFGAQRPGDRLAKLRRASTATASPPPARPTRAPAAHAAAAARSPLRS